MVWELVRGHDRGRTTCVMFLGKEMAEPCSSSSSGSSSNDAVDHLNGGPRRSTSVPAREEIIKQDAGHEPCLLDYLVAGQ